MAQLQRTDDKDVMVGDITALKLEEGGLSDQQAVTLVSTVRDLIAKVNGMVSFGSALTGHRGNLDVAHTDVITPSVANTEFPVVHTLGRVPVGAVLVRRDKVVNIYDSSVGSWTETMIFLKADAASATIKVLLY